MWDKWLCVVRRIVVTAEQLTKNQKEMMSVKYICNLFAIFWYFKKTYNATEINNKNFRNANKGIRLFVNHKAIT